MISRDIVKAAIEFKSPPRLPFWQHEVEWAPDDVLDVWEMDRGKKGWYFKDGTLEDDWGCVWSRSQEKNMGQVVGHPLADWAKLDGYRPPDPRDPYYYERIEEALRPAGDRYVVVTCHFNLVERLHMLHGFAQTMEDFILEPEKVEQVLDMILEFKLEQIDELGRRFGDRVNGLFLTDDWGTQRGPFISRKAFAHFFAARYRKLADAMHSHGWHFILHSCGRVNDLVPDFIAAGIDVLNMQQPQAYGLVDFGKEFAGKVCFLTTADIQSTLPSGDADKVRQEVRELVEHWSTPRGGLIVFNYGDPEALAVKPEMTGVMFKAFADLQEFWK
jgi:uroporphyrinogen decarboxylase